MRTDTHTHQNHHTHTHHTHTPFYTHFVALYSGSILYTHHHHTLHTHTVALYSSSKPDSLGKSSFSLGKTSFTTHTTHTTHTRHSDTESLALVGPLLCLFHVTSIHEYALCRSRAAPFSATSSILQCSSAMNRADLKQTSQHERIDERRGEDKAGGGELQTSTG